MPNTPLQSRQNLNFFIMKNLISIIQVTLAEAVAMFRAVKGHPFSYWATFTEPTLTGGKATYNLFGGKVYKYATYTLVKNRSYDRAIEILCGKLGINFADWKPQAHNYADHLEGNVLFHRGDAHMPELERRLYAQFLLHKDCQIECEYFDAEMRPIAYETIKPYLKSNSSKKQSDLGIAEEEQIACINFAVGSIKQYTLEGQRYEIVAE
jgi:hypothetical protein